MVEHVAIADGERHEPKGITSSSSNDTYVSDGVSSGTWAEPEPKGVSGASAREIYKANGAGSGAWEPVRTGWGSYVDVSSGTQTFNSTPAKLQIDSDSVVAYLPHEIRVSGDLWDKTNDTVTPVRIGDAYMIRLELPVTGKSGSPTLMKFEYDIGGGASPTNVISERDIVVDTPPFSVSITSAFFSLNTFLANGMCVFVSTDTGSVDVDLPGILIVKTHDGLD